MPAGRGAHVAARGIPITLVDGKKATLRYDFGACLDIEEKWGSLDTFSTNFNDSLKQGTKAKRFKMMLAAIAPAVGHAEITEEQLRELLDPTRLDEYDDAVAAAWLETFPSATPAANGGKGRKPKRSRGASGSTSEPSSSAEAKESSGE